MGWIGKLMGGAIGFALGGPLGAIIGATFGHAYDSNQDKTGGRMFLTAGQEAQATFFVAAFSMLGKITKVDGHISKEEIDAIENFMINELHLDQLSRQAAIKIFHTSINSNHSFEDYANQFYAQFMNQPQILEFMIDLLIRVSIADGSLTKNEEDMIRSAAGIFGFDDNRYVRIKNKYVQETDHYYAVLGCSKSDSIEDIKKSYRKLVFEYHPDKIASKGLPEEFNKLAHEKFREINEAYEAIKKERGIK